MKKFQKKGKEKERKEKREKRKYAEEEEIFLPVSLSLIAVVADSSLAGDATSRAKKEQFNSALAKGARGGSQLLARCGNTVISNIIGKVQ